MARSVHLGSSLAALLGAGSLALVGCGDSSVITPTGDGGRAGTGGAPGGGSSAAAPSSAGVSPGGAAGAPVAGDGGQATSGASGMAGGGGTTLGGASATGGDGGATGGGGLGGGAGGSSGGASAGNGAGGNGAKVVLFDGSGLSPWRPKDGAGAAPWMTTPDYFTVKPSSGDIVTRESFGDIKLHVEFWVPATPTTNGEQDRGNSGIYLQGRYEVQVLDSFDHSLEGANDCGAIYELKNADVNAALPPENWQTYEITFRAPRFDGTQKKENARISVVWNGKIAQSEVEVPAPTKLGDAEGPGDAPLRLQDHSHAVRYRNIWLERL